MKTANQRKMFNRRAEKIMEALSEDLSVVDETATIMVTERDIFHFERYISKSHLYEGSNYRKPEPVKVWSKDRIKELELKMKKEGKL